MADYNTLREDMSKLLSLLGETDSIRMIAKFIALAESRFNRDLRLRIQETSANITTVATTKDYSINSNLPGLIEIREVSIATTPISTLEYLAPDVLKDLWEGDPDSQPRAYTLSADDFRIAPAPDTGNAKVVTVVYYKELTPLSTSNLTNALIDDHEDIYLYGSLLQAEPYLVSADQVKVALWRQNYEQAVDSAIVSDVRGRHHGPIRDSQSE